MRTRSGVNEIKLDEQPVRTMALDELRSRYVALFGDEPSAPGAVDEMERVLGVRLPDDFRTISKFYSGGMVGGLSQNAIAVTGPAASIVEDTLRFRAAVHLPQRMVVLAEFDESVAVLDTDPAPNGPAVIWIDSTDANNLADISTLHAPTVWNTYSEFFDFLLKREEDDRRGPGSIRPVIVP